MKGLQSSVYPKDSALRNYKEKNNIKKRIIQITRYKIVKKTKKNRTKECNKIWFFFINYFIYFKPDSLGKKIKLENLQPDLLKKAKLISITGWHVAHRECAYLAYMRDLKNSNIKKMKYRITIDITHVRRRNKGNMSRFRKYKLFICFIDLELSM